MDDRQARELVAGVSLTLLGILLLSLAVAHHRPRLILPLAFLTVFGAVRITMWYRRRRAQ